uniref:RING-type domain-containing protein n=1 Tax=Biomphalaria glabrata TaxID=6526 RepID=A0A2C9L016_BIOGL
MSSNTANEKLSIPYEAIENHILCSICLSVIRGAVLTPCGHHYCSKCITEWVGQKHSCPCCNSSLTTEQFYYNVQFDALIDEILILRDKAEENYYEKMFNSSPDVEILTTSPFEAILKRHFKASLLYHQRYYEKLQQELHQKLQCLEMGLSTNHQPMEDVESVKERLRENLAQSEQLVTEAFDKFLTEHIPSLDIIPVSISVYIPNKDLRIHDVIVKPTDVLSDLKPRLELAMQERCDDVISWNDDTGVRLLFGPLSKTVTYDVPEVLNNLHNLDDVHSLLWDTRPILQYKMRPGSEIVLQDVFKSQSDIPKRCFVNVFDENTTQTVDYFSCNKCSVKWICKSCIQCCHAGHSVTPFVMNHRPNWACCYCPKRKLCRIQDK